MFPGELGALVLCFCTLDVLSQLSASRSYQPLTHFCFWILGSVLYSRFCFRDLLLWFSSNTATHFAETNGSKPGGVQEQSVDVGAYNSVSLILKNTKDPTSLPLVGLSYLILKSFAFFQGSLIIL